MKKLIPEQLEYKISQLPKWAQDELASRERRANALQDNLNEMSSKHPGTNVKVDNMRSDDDYDLPNGSQLIFFLSDSREKYHDSVSIRVDRNHPNRLHVMGNSFGNVRLSVQPSSSNVVFITFAKD